MPDDACYVCVDGVIPGYGEFRLVKIKRSHPSGNKYYIRSLNETVGHYGVELGKLRDAIMPDSELEDYFRFNDDATYNLLYLMIDKF